MLANLLLVAILVIFTISAAALYELRQQGATLVVRRWSEVSSWVALGIGILWAMQVFSNPEAEQSGYFYFGSLQNLLVPYILLMGVLVKRFAFQYLQSDSQYPMFFLKIKLLICLLLLFVVLNHAGLLALVWIASGCVIYSLIAHTQTTAAKNAARLALNRFLLGDIFLVLGMVGFIQASGSFFLTDWFKIFPTVPATQIMLPLLCLVIGAFSKTAVIPFQKWLVHSLTAPTPVSAIMHAGFVNAGAILLAKISPLLIGQSAIMAFILIMGLISALYGSAAMLVQTDVKRYLTFSTIGQMGFMMMECGLGAFHLAIFHLIVHGFFKARLFLSAGSVIEHRQAIRNVKYQQTQYLHGRASLPARLQMAGIIASSVAATWLLLLQSPLLQHHLSELPLLLLSVLVLSTLFAQTTIIKAKGIGFKGLTIAVLFSLTLVAVYVLYDLTAAGILPGLNQVYVAESETALTVGLSLLLSLGLLSWLAYLNLLPIPFALKDKCYVFLLKAAGRNGLKSTFSERV